MNRLASMIAYTGTVAAAALAAALTSTAALAESPTIDTTPFVSTLSRAEVRADLQRARGQVSAAGIEWDLQMNDRQPMMSGMSRAQVTAEYIAARDQVLALNSEDSGSRYFAQADGRTGGTGTLVAARLAR